MSTRTSTANLVRFILVAILIGLLLTGCLKTDKVKNLIPTPQPAYPGQDPPLEFHYIGQDLQGNWIDVKCTWNKEHGMYFCQR